MDQKSREPPSKFVINHILQAIAHVRQRKARPDIDEICRQMKRRQNWDRRETEMRLEELLDLGIILRVVYKNNFSYRDPLDLQTGHVSGVISNTEGLVNKLQLAIDGAIGLREADSATYNGRDENSAVGASVEEIEAYLENQRKDDKCCLRLRGNPLKEVLASESHRSTVVKVKLDGTVRYSVGSRVNIEPRESESTITNQPTVHETVSDFSGKPEENQQEEGQTPTDRQRPPSGRMKKRKYDDSTYELPPVKKSRKQAQMQNATADAPIQIDTKPAVAQEEAALVVAPEYRLAGMFRRCNEIHQMEIPSRHEGQESEMLFCHGCKMKAHPDCLNYSAELLAKINRQMWRCVTCKKCACCSLQLRTPSPLTCSGCDLAYHKSCHIPVVRKKPKDGWLCMKCTGSDAQQSEETSATGDAEAQEPAPNADCNSSGSDSSEVLFPELSAQDQGEEEECSEDSQDSIHARSADVKLGGKTTAFPPTPRDSPSLDDASVEPMRQWQLSGESQHDPQRVQKISRFDGSDFPDPSRWTVDEVHSYISSFASDDSTYADGAEALRKEAVDGESLMYLSREDVLKRFSLKVGPALKLFRLIKNMQTNGNAHKYMYCKS